LNSYRSGDIKTVTWVSTDIISDTTGEANTVDLKYSSDGGSTWVTIAEREVNDGSYSWAIPLIPSSKNCVVRITHSEDATIYSDSETFEVIGGPVPLQGISISSISKVDNTITINGYLFGENQYPICAVDASSDGGSTWPVSCTIIDYGDTQITATATLPSGSWTIRVTGADGTQAVSTTSITISSNIIVRTNISIAISLGSF
jgi:hypothetical protein